MGRRMKSGSLRSGERCVPRKGHAAKGITRLGFEVSSFRRIYARCYSIPCGSALWESPAQECRRPEQSVGIPSGEDGALVGEALPPWQAPVVRAPRPLPQIVKRSAITASDRWRIPDGHTFGGDIDRAPRGGDSADHVCDPVAFGLPARQRQRRQWLDRHSRQRCD